MLNIVHKYVRRLIVWFSTPSQEEIDARVRHVAHRDAQRRADSLSIHQGCLRTSMLSSVQYKPLPSAYLSLGTTDLEFCAGIIRETRDSGLCPQERAAEHLDAIRRVSASRALA
ncbi:hypothetical protein [Mesorhizobium sp. M0203]|uniref:hypothetical protein n=1 Tax=Mesorhizobium sp. M0203 TaxID=2956912 RepID=UPI00333DD980